MPQRIRITSRVAIPLRAIAGRLALGLLLAASFSLLILSRSNSDFAQGLRAGVSDVVVPVINAFARPVDAARSAGNWFGEMAQLNSENAALRQQTRELMRWQAVAREMETENRSLKRLLGFTRHQGLNYVTARIVASSGGAFGRTATIDAGTNDGVEKYQTIISDAGLVGRVVDAGSATSRVILITDMNSRVPVVMESTRERAILAGDNTDLPTLNYMGDNVRPQIGERVVTAADAKLLPPGIPVGVVMSVENGRARVQPLADWQTLEYISAVQYEF